MNKIGVFFTDLHSVLTVKCPNIKVVKYNNVAIFIFLYIYQTSYVITKNHCHVGEIYRSHGYRSSKYVNHSYADYRKTTQLL